MLDQNAIDDEIDDAPIVHTRIPATDAPRPAITAPRSVFELATIATHVKHGAKAKGGVKYGQAKYRKEQQDGRVINIGSRYPADRMTPEKSQAEEARRARQKPPRPTAAFKTISKKLQSMVG